MITSPLDALHSAIWLKRFNTTRIGTSEREICDVLLDTISEADAEVVRRFAAAWPDVAERAHDVLNEMLDRGIYLAADQFLQIVLVTPPLNTTTQLAKETES